MPRRPRLIDLTAGVLVVVAVLVWSVWGTREFRRRPPATPPSPPTAGAIRPPAAPDQARPLPVAPRGSLERPPEDPAPSAVSGDGLLDLASPRHSKEVRLEALRLLGDRGYDEKQIRQAEALFNAEADEDIRLALLLGVTKAASPGAAAIARQGAADRSGLVRSVAIAALDLESEGNRHLLIGMALSDSSDLVRGNAMLLIQERTGDPGVLDAILTVSRQDACDENRKRALQLLGTDLLRGNGRVLEALQWSAARDRSPEVRAEAQKLLESAKKGK